MPARELPTAIGPYRLCALFHRTNTLSCTIRSTSLTLQDVGLSVSSGKWRACTVLAYRCPTLPNPIRPYLRAFSPYLHAFSTYLRALPLYLCAFSPYLHAFSPYLRVFPPYYALFHRTCTLFHRTCTLFHRTCTLFHRTCTLFHRTCTLFHRTCTLFHRTCTLFHRTDLIPCAVLTLQDMGLSAVGSGCLHGDCLLLSDPTDYAHFFTVPTRSLAPYAAPNSLCRTWVCQ